MADAGIFHRVSNGTMTPRETARLAAEAAANYYARANGFRFDPFRSIDQFVVLCCLIAGAAALLYYWRTVVKCVVGEDAFAWDRFNCVHWSFFQCCGCCDGEWTRYISTHCCCCHPRLRGRNLKRAFAEALGFYPTAVRVQNIIVGSLPQDYLAFFPSNPDLFVQVTISGSTPRLNTEVVMEASSECVQFTSNLTLLVKNNPRGELVTFAVKRMRLTRSELVAECQINPARLIAWAQQSKRVRLRLGGPSRKSDPYCTPWILLDLSVPQEARYMRKEVGAVSPIIRIEQTLKSPGRSRRLSDGSVQLPLETTTGFAAITDTTIFPLMSPQGVELEEEVDMVAQAARHTRSCINIAAYWLAVLTLMYLVLRIFTGGCIEEYRHIEGLWLYSKQRKEAFDPSDHVLATGLQHKCKFQHMAIEIFNHLIRRTEMASSHSKTCIPGQTRTEERCAHLRNASLPHMLGLPCPSWTCTFDRILEPFDLHFILVFLVCTLGICIGKTWETHLLYEDINHPHPSRRHLNSALRSFLGPCSCMLPNGGM